MAPPHSHDPRDRYGDSRATQGRREHPADTTPGGLNALALTITVHPDDNLARCHDQAYELNSCGDLGASLFERLAPTSQATWSGCGSSKSPISGSTFTAETPPDATQAGIDTLTRMVESITFPE